MKFLYLLLASLFLIIAVVPAVQASPIDDLFNSVTGFLGLFFEEDSSEELGVFCTTSIDEEGCRVSECSDGTVKKDCPTPDTPPQEVECKTYVEEGCRVKVCTDGTEERYCPGDEVDDSGECTKHMGEKGCIATVCTDGSETRECPDQACPSKEAIAEQGDACKMQGLKVVTVTDPQGCEMIVCRGKCPAAEEVNARIRACKDSGLDYATSSDEFGCENVTCRSMPQQAQGRPQECRESYNPATGLTTIECGRQGCAPYSDPENIAGQKYKCVEAGGKPVLEKDSSGCERLNCKFPEGEAAEREKQPLIGAADCPPDEAIERIIEGCRNRGYTPNVSKNLGGCTSVECVPHVVSCPTDSLEGLRKNRADCEASGGRVVQAFGPTGCQSNVCVPEGRVKEVCKGIPREAYGKCEGNKFIVEVDEEDCLVFFECLDRKEGAIEAPGEIKKMPGVTQLRATVRKLEGLKAELHNFAVKADRLAEYYESVGNISGAERYRRIALLYRAAMGRVEEVNRMLGDNAESMDEETLKGLKEDLRATKRVIGDIPYLMHSSEQEFGELTGEVLDCGSDPECLTNAFSNCQKAVIEQKSGEAFMQAEIKGLEGNRCVFVITARMGNETYTTTCKLDYLFAHPSQEDLQRDCEGDTDALFGQVRITSVQASIRPEEEVMRGMPVEETRSGVPMGEGMSDEEAKRAMEEEAMKKAMEGQG